MLRSMHIMLTILDTVAQPERLSATAIAVLLVNLLI
jgi:hypothetical protein